MNLHGTDRCAKKQKGEHLMERTPSRLLNNKIGFTRLASAALAAGVCLLAAPSAAQAASVPNPTLNNAPPVAPCPSAGAVSAAYGSSLPTPTSFTRASTEASGPLKGVKSTVTVCTYVSYSSFSTAASMANLKYAIVIMGRVSKTLPPGSVSSYMKSEFANLNSKMPAGSTFTAKYGSQFGLPTVWLSGKIAATGLNFNFYAAISYQGKKIAGGEVVGGSVAKANAVAKLAVDAVGL
ncbi:MAG TPA: hypothetical protein VME20_01630 [Acidimicrobiales bacterium]|nr:hypothetical protein [Acidimicrobiales bacterium]